MCTSEQKHICNIAISNLQSMLLLTLLSGIFAQINPTKWMLGRSSGTKFLSPDASQQSKRNIQIRK